MCLLCYNQGIETPLSIDNKSSTGLLKSHLATHEDEYKTYMAKKAQLELLKQKERQAPVQKQPTITSHFKSLETVEERESKMHLETGLSMSIYHWIQASLSLFDL
jgi:hypothetical protein